MSRIRARDAAMKLLFEAEFGVEGGMQTIDSMFDGERLETDDIGFIEQIVDGVKEHKEELDRVILKYAVGWTIERMAKVDLSILRVAIYEILFMEDIPFKVSANEAVELAKAYGSEKSSSFINGMLGEFIRDEGIVKN